MGTRQAGFLQIAFSPFLCPKLLTSVSDLHFERPDDPVFRITSLDTVGIIRGVLEGQYLAGIGCLPTNYSERQTRELLDKDLILCISKPNCSPLLVDSFNVHVSLCNCSSDTAQ